jgi:hypothetical protein
MGKPVAAHGARAWFAQKAVVSDGAPASQEGLAYVGGIFWDADG